MIQLHFDTQGKSKGSGSVKHENGGEEKIKGERKVAKTDAVDAVFPSRRIQEVAQKDQKAKVVREGEPENKLGSNDSHLKSVKRSTLGGGGYSGGKVLGKIWPDVHGKKRKGSGKRGCEKIAQRVRPRELVTLKPRPKKRKKR